VKIKLAPLAERKEDIPLLINAIIQKFNARMGKHVMGVSNEALNFLLAYDYPGNIRELENIMEHAFVLCKNDLIVLDCLPKEFVGMPRERGKSDFAIKGKSPLDEVEAKLIRDALKRNEENRIKTAGDLAMSRVTLWRKMRKYGLV
jgi:transcriptional regulator with PAS, ATPase and Fis domain